KDYYVDSVRNFVLGPIVPAYRTIPKPLFTDFVSRIELTLNSERKVVIDEQLAIIIEMLKEDLEYVLDNKRDKVIECLQSLEKNEDVAKNLDIVDSIYLLSNKRHKFDYCLSPKINRYIISLG